MWRERGVWSGLLLGACIATAATSGVARADDLSPCQFSPFGSLDYSYQAGLVPHMDGARAAAAQATGSQYAEIWLQSRDQAWHVGLAPGSLTVDEAEAAIIAALPGHMAPDAADYMAARLHVDPMPYNLAELVGVQAAIVGRFLAAEWGVGWGVGVGCTTSDAFRVEVTLYDDSSPDIRAQAQAIVADYGDRARLQLSDSGPPVPAVGTGPSPPPGTGTSPMQSEDPLDPLPRVSTYAAMPVTKRCVKGQAVQIKIKASQRAAVASLNATVGGHRTTVRGARLSRPLTVRLAAGRSTVTVKLRLSNGRIVERAYAYRLCG